MDIVKKFIKTHPYVALAILLAIVAQGYWIFTVREERSLEAITVSRGTIIQEVSVTGSVVPVEVVDLSFEGAGKISKIQAEVGDKVTAGEVLISLENEDLLGSLNQAKAQLRIDQAKLEELKRGTRTEEIEVKRSELEKAERDLENYYQEVIDTLHDTYAVTDDSARVKTAGIFSGYKFSSYSITYASCNPEAATRASNLRLKSEDTLDTWKAEIDALSNTASKESLEKALTNSRVHIAVVRDMLQNVSDTLVTGCTATDTKLDTYRSNISTARSNITSAAQDISGLEQSISAQKLSVITTQRELDLKLAGSAPEQIQAQEAQIEYSRARVQSAEAELAKTIIRAPFNGTVTRQDGKIGAAVVAASPVVGIISESNFEIEANIPEADIAKLKLRDEARVTLDAHGSDIVFRAIVLKIDPAETVIEGVPTYKATLQFKEADEKIRSGMTANIDVETASRRNVISVPQRAIISKNGLKAVRILDGEEVREVTVELGLKGSLGDVEVISGLNEGDRVILFLDRPESKSTFLGH